MHINHAISTDPWNALRLITRGQNIHECLHILYSNFPPEAPKDPRATTKARRVTLALIANIIEDAFIEAVGLSIFDNLELYLQFHRLSTLFSNTPTQGTVDRAFEGDQGSQKEPLALTQYLNYMLLFLLYPMVQLHPPGDNFSAYVEQTKQLFLDGAVCGNAVERFAYAQQIFDIIQPLIPLSELEIQDDRFNKLLFGSKTHNGEGISIATITSKGRSVQITRRLFTDLEGKPLPEKDFNQQLIAVTKKYADEKAAVTSIVLFEPVVTKWNGTQFDCHNIHNGIEIIETKPKPNLSLRKAYQNIYSKYRININSYNSRFTQLLKARVPSREEHKLFGSGISSRHLADTKKRYWYRKDEEFGIPDVAVMLLIDGSGSMSGARREEAMVSCVA